MDEIVVVGAGIVGVAIAFRLRRAGYTVTLIDAGEPGEGCSFGNAGIIANSFILPLSDPRHILGAPRMLADPTGPLAIRARDLATVAPWLLRFAANALPARQRRTIAGLKALNAAALPAWRALLDAAGAGERLHNRGMIELVGAVKALPGLMRSATRLRGEGVPIDVLSPGDVADLEPSLAGRTAGALFHSGVAHVDDPFALVQTLAAAFRAAGGTVVRDRIATISRHPDRITLLGQRAYAADQAIIAAGFGSRGLLAPFAEPIPLGIEYGYHQMVRSPISPLSRPLSFSAEGFVATPLAGGLRVAGTVELASVDAAPDWRRAELLLKKARAYLPGLDPTPDAPWRGGRPSFPDSLPAIGRFEACPRILYAFGHQHLGLTQAAISADAILSLVAGHAAPLDLAPYSLARFR